MRTDERGFGRRAAPSEAATDRRRKSERRGVARWLAAWLLLTPACGEPLIGGPDDGGMDAGDPDAGVDAGEPDAGTEPGPDAGIEPDAGVE